MSRRIAIIGNQSFAMRNFRGPLISAAANAGAEIFAFAPDYTDADRSEIRSLGAMPIDFPLRRTGLTPLADMLTIRVLTRLLKQLGPDAVLSFSTKPSIFGTIAAKRAGIGQRYALVEGLGHVYVDTGLRVLLLRAVVNGLYRVSLGGATRVLFLNNDDRMEFIERGLIDSDRAVTIGAIGVDLQYWQPTPPVVEPLTFAFVGRLLRDKGIVEYVEAARRIKKTNSEVRFLVLGALDENPSSLSAGKVSAWVKEGTIEWHGHVDVRTWLHEVSVFVLPSYREGVPRSAQEAMAMAKPVITTDVPGCRETVRPHQNGFLVAPRQVEPLEQAMRRFIDDTSLVARMGAASRVMAEELFDVRQANARIMAAMEL